MSEIAARKAIDSTTREMIRSATGDRTCCSCRWFKNPKCVQIYTRDEVMGHCDHPAVRMVNGATKGVPVVLKKVGFVANAVIGEGCKEHTP